MAEEIKRGHHLSSIIDLFAMETDTGDSDSDYQPEYEPEMFQVAGKINLQVLSVVPPPLEFMSALHSQQQEISGRQVWCGSLLCANVLCQLQEQDKHVFHKKRILELGSGTGLLGMVASKLGDPRCVILTDGDDKAVALLEENLANPANDMNQTVSKTKALLWGEKQQMEDFSQWCRSTWPDTFENDVKFDYIIAGDVMYKAELPHLFFGTCDKFLETNGTLWLCHIPRANVGHELVVSQAENAGFSCQPFDASQISVEDVPIDDLQRARVYCIRRRNDTST